MNPIAEEIESYLGSASMTDEEYLAHYGMPRRSGRYPWGSGQDPYQSSRDFLGRVEQMRKSGFTYTDENGKKWTGDNAIAKSLGYNSTDFRTVYAIAKDERRSDMVATAKRLRDKEGMNNSEIGRKMGINESSVRSLLDPNSESRMKQARDTAKFLKEQVDKKGMVDVGAGVNNDLKITKEKLDQALFILQAEGGYEVYGGRFSQVTNKGQMTTQRVLCKPGTPHSAIYDFDNVKTVTDYISRDDGKTFEKKFTYPESLDSKRLMIRYKEDGGIDRDGTVELRRNVPDLSLGESKYSQVRIMVDGKKYIKGMAVYKDDKDFPPGVDVIFNTNKSKSVPKLEVLKDVKPDPDNPFGSLIKDADQGGQYWYTDKNGKKKLGLINKRSDEGDWTEWKDALPSQFLSKQSKAMAEKQLGIAKADKQAEYEAIMALTNPTVKKYYLDKFASSCDSAAVHLKAAALPGQKYHVTGTPDLYCTPHLLNVMLLARDLNGRRIYDSKADLAAALNVASIQTVEQFEGLTRTASDGKKKLLGLFVNLADYQFGATRGGEVTKFEDFDMDFNRYKYMLETRLSGALTQVYSAIALEEPAA